MKSFYNERKTNPLFKPLARDLSESHTSTICLNIRILHKPIIAYTQSFYLGESEIERTNHKQKLRYMGLQVIVNTFEEESDKKIWKATGG